MSQQAKIISMTGFVLPAKEMIAGRTVDLEVVYMSDDDGTIYRLERNTAINKVTFTRIIA